MMPKLALSDESKQHKLDRNDHPIFAKVPPYVSKNPDLVPCQDEYHTDKHVNLRFLKFYKS
jgi:hypothetical protein